MFVRLLLTNSMKGLTEVNNDEWNVMWVGGHPNADSFSNLKPYQRVR